MRVAVTGATGVIGGALVGELRRRGDEAAALSRDAARARERLGVDAYEWKAPKSERPPIDALRGSDAVVNLLGETIAQRWSDEARREIRDSRILTTRNLVAELAELPEGERPRVLVSQSASGWYGARGDHRPARRADAARGARLRVSPARSRAGAARGDLTLGLPACLELRAQLSHRLAATLP